MNFSLRLFIQRIVILAVILAFQTALASVPASVPAYFTKPMYAAPIAQFESTPTSSTLAEKNYNQLRNLLPMYQNAATYPWPPLSANAKLKLHAKNPSVTLLRERLMLLGDLSYDNSSIEFDESVLAAVKNFQARNGLEADGVVGKNTRAQLNILPEERIRQIEVNMRRWASLANKLGPRFIMVNVPEYQLYLIENDQKILSMRAIVGKPERQTPEVVSKITRIVFNPYWSVPSKIARRDIVPKILADPNYLYQNNIHVFESQDDNAMELDDRSIDWHSVHQNGTDFYFRQDPGENNSLGLVKFEIPNSFDIYLHDTPAKELFDESQRAFSSGCIRLERAFELIPYVMENDPSWNDERLQQLLINGKTTYVRVRQPIPVIITYITAWVDEEGRLNFRDDIYHRDYTGI